MQGFARHRGGPSARHHAEDAHRVEVRGDSGEVQRPEPRGARLERVQGPGRWRSRSLQIRRHRHQHDDQLHQRHRRILRPLGSRSPGVDKKWRTGTDQVVFDHDRLAGRRLLEPSRRLQQHSRHTDVLAAAARHRQLRKSPLADALLSAQMALGQEVYGPALRHHLLQSRPRRSSRERQSLVSLQFNVN